MSDYIPQELVFEILTKLPVQSLIRSTLVCKSWYSLITSPRFIAAHLNLSIANNKIKNDPALLLRYFSNNDKKEHYSMHRDDEALGFEYEEIEFPFKSQIGYFRIVGCCNGLICLSDDLFGDTDVIVLWNLSIRKSVTLPPPKKLQWPHMFVLGFGADPVNHDFKVVRIVYYKEYLNRYKVPPAVEIYSLSLGSWRQIRTAAPLYCMVEFMWTQAFVNDAVHWTAYNPREGNGFRSLIVWFHMGEEVFGELMLPEALVGELASNLVVTTTRESLAVIKTDKQIGSTTCCVWVMREYGVAESWTRLYTIDLGGALERIVGFRKNGEVILSLSELVCYDPESGEIRDLGICGNTRSFYLDTYVETLMLLKGQNRAIEDGSCTSERE